MARIYNGEVYYTDFVTFMHSVLPIFERFWLIQCWHAEHDARRAIFSRLFDSSRPPSYTSRHYELISYTLSKVFTFIDPVIQRYVNDKKHNFSHYNKEAAIVTVKKRKEITNEKM